MVIGRKPPAAEQLLAIPGNGAFTGADEAFDTMRYARPEIERIAHVAFGAARGSPRAACSHSGPRSATMRQHISSTGESMLNRTVAR